MTRMIDLTGEVFFETLTVLRQNGRIRGNVAWLVKCICGREVTFTGFAMRRGDKKHCGDKSHSIAGNELPGMVGEQFTRLYVESHNAKQSKELGRDRYNVLCECGVKKVVNGYALRNRTTKSCGCYGADKTALRNKDLYAYRNRNTDNPDHNKRTWVLTDEQKKLVERYAHLPRLVLKDYDLLSDSDALSFASIALIDSIHTYDSAKVKARNPGGYLYACLKLRIRRWNYHNRSTLLTVPSEQHFLNIRINRIQGLRYAKKGKRFTDVELSELSGMTTVEINELQKTNNQTSLDLPVAGDESKFIKQESLGNLVVNKKALSPFENACLVEELTKKLLEQQKREKDEAARIAVKNAEACKNLTAEELSEIELAFQAC